MKFRKKHAQPTTSSLVIVLYLAKANNDFYGIPYRRVKYEVSIPKSSVVSQ